jgi:GNAT superfamily N-acetyltransferase
MERAAFGPPFLVLYDRPYPMDLQAFGQYPKAALMHKFLLPIVVGRTKGGGRRVGGTCSYDGGAIAAAELRFREDLWRSAPKDAVEEAEVRHRRFGPILATVFGDLPDVSLMNLVQGAAEADQGDLAAALEWVRSREVDYLVSVSADRPGSEAVEAWLKSRGYEQGPPVRRFAHPGTEERAVIPSPLEISKLGPLETEGMSHIYGEVLGLSSLATILMLGLPTKQGWHCYRASLGGQEVACGAMFVLGKVALFGLEATLPDARRHGCHTALLERRLIDMRREGCDIAVAEVCDRHPAGPGAVRNLKNLGFEEIAGSATWRRPTGIA